MWSIEAKCYGSLCGGLSVNLEIIPTAKCTCFCVFVNCVNFKALKKIRDSWFLFSSLPVCKYFPVDRVYIRDKKSVGVVVTWTNSALCKIMFQIQMNVDQGRKIWDMKSLEAQGISTLNTKIWVLKQNEQKRNAILDVRDFIFCY